MVMELIKTAKSSICMPASNDEIQTQFTLLASGMKFQNGGNAKAMAAAYEVALNGFSSWAIKQSVRDILKGGADGLSKTFMPSCAELAVYCGRLEKSVTYKIEAIERLLAAPEEAAPIKADPERRAKIEAMIAMFNSNDTINV